MTVRTQAQASPSLYVNRLNLDRLLSRLEHIILSDDGSSHLKNDIFERRRVSANVEHARSLLLRLERESAAVKVYSRKQSLQSELQDKRDAIKKLNRRLRELDQLDDGDDDDDDDDNHDADSATNDEENEANDNDSDGAGTATGKLSNHSNGYAPARSASAGLDVHVSDEADGSMQRAAGQLSSVLRARRGQGTSGGGGGGAAAAAAASGNSANPHTKIGPTPSTQMDTNANASANTKQPSTLPPASSSFSPSSDETGRLAQHEKLLTHNRAEEQVLTESLLSMAQALKSSARQFQTTLETDKEVLGAAVEGLDRNTEGMDAAGRRLGQLKRKTSGWAWWRHVSLYVWIAGLYVALVLVFLLPKLRL